MTNNEVRKILKSYNSILIRINSLKSEQKHYQELLSSNDLSELEYYKKENNINISFKYMIYSPVEMEVLNKDKLHNLNGAIIRQLMSKTTTMLQEFKNRKNTIDHSLKHLENLNEFIVRQKFFENCTYKQITEQVKKKYKKTMSTGSLRKRMEKSLVILRDKINPIYF